MGGRAAGSPAHTPAPRPAGALGCHVAPPFSRRGRPLLGARGGGRSAPCEARGGERRARRRRGGCPRRRPVRGPPGTRPAPLALRPPLAPFRLPRQTSPCVGARQGVGPPGAATGSRESVSSASRGHFFLMPKHRSPLGAGAPGGIPTRRPPRGAGFRSRRFRVAEEVSCSGLLLPTVPSGTRDWGRPGRGTAALWVH